MAGTATTGRSAWGDRFSEPTIAALRAELPKSATGLFDAARSEVLGLGEDVEERVVWQGLPWRWTMVFMSALHGDRALAYLVPNPVSLQLGVPLSAELLGELDVRRVKKTIRDGLMSARVVGSVHWASWELSSRGQLDEVLELVKVKHGSRVVRAVRGEGLRAVAARRTKRNGVGKA